MEEDSNVSTVGKQPGNKNSELDNLRQQLEKAVDEEDYEEAARIRDRIKDMESYS